MDYRTVIVIQPRFGISVEEMISAVPEIHKLLPFSAYVTVETVEI